MSNYNESITRTSRTLLSLGANEGDKEKNLIKAIELLESRDVLKILKKSSFYYTEPYGVKNQDWFINLCIYGETSLSPYNLLKQCKNIETLIGRKERQRWHEREIDIDIILYGDTNLKEDDLIIPHKEYKKRNFVLIPAAEIVGKITPPDSNKTIKELSEICIDKSGIKKI